MTGAAAYAKDTDIYLESGKPRHGALWQTVKTLLI